MVQNLSPRLIAARALFQQNRMAEAEKELRELLELDSRQIPPKLFLGAILLRTNRSDEAASLLSSVLDENPNQVDALGLMAIVRRSLGDPGGSAEMFQRLIRLGHASPDLFNNLGSCFLELDDPVAAGRAFRSAIELDRTCANSFYNLGMALKLAGNSFETFATFKRAIELDPDFFDSYVQLWQQMRQLLNWKEGLPLLEQGFRKNPSSPQMMVMLASVYGKVGRPKRAEQLFKAAAAVEPTAGPPYAHWLQEEGQFANSIPILKDALRQQPLQGEAYYYLSVANCFDLDGEPLKCAVARLLEDRSLAAEGEMFLHYAMAKEFDNEKDFQSAMQNYDRANDLAYELYNSRITHDYAAVEAEQATLAKLYTQETIERLRRSGSESEVPLFIVGMIRTGTTLLDQILASHPQVKSAGEQPFWQVSAGRVNRRWLESGVSEADLREPALRYLEVLREAAGDVKRVTDKMPTNFSHMGLMSVMFPKAKFIHIRRSPLDTGLSIYTTFLGRGTQFAYNKRNIVDYFKAYLRTMELWRKVIPSDQMIEIDYEDLVSNKEAVLREVISFCSLEWDDAVLSHERSSSQVSTPSLWTARQPVNTKSVERWRRYEPWLGELMELGDLSHPPICPWGKGSTTNTLTERTE